MKANELRFNNWVNFEYKGVSYGNVFIDKNYFSHYEKEDYIYKPIPLTEDWLVKFGFERTSYGRQFKGFHLEASSRVLATDVLSGFSWEQVVDKKYLRILHVHQLQNLYFALTNEELKLI